MRFLAGLIGAALAAGLLGYEVVQFYKIGAAYLGSDQSITVGGAAYNLGGLAGAMAVAYEAFAFFIAKTLAEEGHKDEARIALLLLVAAMAVTSRYEVKAQIGGQANKVTFAQDTLSHKESLNHDLEAVQKARDAWAAHPERTRTWQTEFDRLSKQVEELQRQVSQHAGASDPDADAAAAAALTGVSKAIWVILLSLPSLLFWALVRAFGLALGMRCMQFGLRRKPSVASETGKLGQQEQIAAPKPDYGKYETYGPVPEDILKEEEPEQTDPLEKAAEDIKSGKSPLADDVRREVNAARSEAGAAPLTPVQIGRKLGKHGIKSETKRRYVAKEVSARKTAQPA